MRIKRAMAIAALPVRAGRARSAATAREASAVRELPRRGRPAGHEPQLACAQVARKSRRWRLRPSNAQPPDGRRDRRAHAHLHHLPRPEPDPREEARRRQGPAAPDRMFGKKTTLTADERSEVCQTCHQKDPKRAVGRQPARERRPGLRHLPQCTPTRTRCSSRPCRPKCAITCHKEQRSQIGRPRTTRCRKAR